MFQKLKTFVSENKELLLEKGIILAGAILGTIIVTIGREINKQKTTDHIVIDIIQE